MYNFILRSLWKVVNGRAVAPPGIMFIIGVSTSMKPRLSKYLRTNLITLDLIINVYLVLLFIIKSRYLFLNLDSASLNPTWAYGNICKHGDNKTT